MLASFFLWSNLGFLSGIILASFNTSWLYSLIISLLLFKNKSYWKIILFFLLFFFLAYNHYFNYQEKNKTIGFEKYVKQKVILKGKVFKEIEPGVNYQKIIFEVYFVNNVKNKALVLLSTAKYPEFKYGDVLEVTGVIEVPTNFSEFKYDRYLARYNIYHTVYFPRVVYISHVDSLFCRLLSFKKSFYSLINQALPEPESGLATALLLGYKSTLAPQEKISFSCCGLSHLVAISGSHLTLLSIMSFNLLISLGISRRSSFWPILIFIWFYVIITGFQASAGRSVIMGSLSIWGERNGRRDNSGRLLIVTANIMLFSNPLILRADLGFQLSFLAMIALIYFFPLGEKIWGKGEIKDVLALTFFSQLLTWPIIAVNFGVFSLISPIANLLLVWIFSFLLPYLLGVTIVSFFVSAMKIIFFIPAYFMLHYVILIADLLAKWQYSCFEFKISWTFLILYYLTLFLSWLLVNRYLRRR